MSDPSKTIMTPLTFCDHEIGHVELRSDGELMVFFNATDATERFRDFVRNHQIFEFGFSYAPAVEKERDAGTDTTSNDKTE